MNNRRFTVIYLSLVIVSTILATYFVSFSVQHPYIGALVKKADGEYKIAETEPNTWSSRNLNIGDILLSVDGEPPSKVKTIQKWRMLEQAREITVLDSASGKVEGYQVVPRIDTQVVFQVILPVIVFILSLYCSFLIYKNKREATRSSSMLLILFLLDISLAYITGGASARGEYIARSAVTVFFVLVPIFYLHFIYHYFKELNSHWFSKKWIWFSYSLVVFNTLINLLTFSEYHPLGIDAIHAKALNLASFMFLFILSFGMIFIGLKKVQYKAQRYLVRGLVFSNILAFLPFVLLYVIPYILFQKQIISPVILAGFLLIIPFSLVYQFLVKKIYDIEFIVGRLKYYAFLSVIPSLIGIFLIVALQSNDALVFTIRGFLVISLIMFLGFYLKEMADFKFSLMRISEKHNYQERIFEFTKKIRSANEFDEVIEELKSTIVDTLLVSEIAVVELNKDFSLHKISPSTASILDYRGAMMKASEEVGLVLEEDKGFVVNVGETQSRTYILVGMAQINTPKLSRDELSWLKTLAYYTNVTIESFIKIEQFMEHLEMTEEEGEKSTWLIRVLYQLEEKQRSLLAKDLHDSVLQDLLSIRRKIEMDAYIGDASGEGIPVHKTAQSLIIDDMNNVISMIRETCHELRPNVLFDLGLEKGLKRLVEQHIHENGFNIRFTSNKIGDDIQSDIQLNLYRITQELLNNTKKHSNAKNIVLMLVKIKDKLVLHYEDDGDGADPEKLFGKTGSMGLSGIRERVMMLNGTMEVTTEVNKGFKILIEI